jgi:hypothetical protein
MIQPRLTVVPCSLRDAVAYVRLHHRKHHAPQGGKFAVAVSDGDSIRGVAIVGNPVARMLNDGWTAEVTRVATDGCPNACSALYGASWRAWRAMGGRRLVTYTGREEPGTSLRASGWKLIGECGGGSWNRENRPRVDKHPTQMKMRWEMTA